MMVSEPVEEDRSRNLENLPKRLKSSIEVETVLLQVTSDVFAGQTIDAHELHYGLGNGVFDAEVRDGVNEALVELWGPHEAGPF